MCMWWRGDMLCLHFCDTRTTVSLYSLLPDKTVVLCLENYPKKIYQELLDLAATSKGYVVARGGNTKAMGGPPW
jgi:hypothetical protein